MNELDLPAGRAQHTQRVARDVRIVEHERVKLVDRGCAIFGRLHDHQPALVAEPAALALAAEELDHVVAISPAAAARDRSVALGIGGTLTRVVARTSSRGRGRAIDHGFLVFRFIARIAVKGTMNISGSSFGR